MSAADAQPPPTLRPNLVEALKKAEKQLTCYACLDSYADPRILPCLHVFCRRCIKVRQTDSAKIGSVLFCCPVCGVVADLTAMGESDLIPAYHVHHLYDIRDVLSKALVRETGYECDKCHQGGAVVSSFCRDCGQYICDDCAHTHELWSELRAHEVASIATVVEDAARFVPPKRRHVRCSKHDKDLELYCKTCGEPICHNCTVQQHRNHDYHLASDVFPAHLEGIEVRANVLRKTLALIEDSQREFDGCAGRIASQRDSIQQSIDGTIAQLHEELERRRRDFSEQLREIAEGKLRALALQRREVDALQKQLTDALALADRYVLTRSETEVLAVSRVVARRGVELVNSYQPDLLVPTQVANAIFKPQRLQEGCTPYRGVCITQLCPSQCVVSSAQSVEVAFTNMRSTIVVHLKDENGAEYFSPTRHVEAVLRSPSDSVACRVERHSNGTYLVSYTPVFPKRYSLNITISKTHVKGSPFIVLVRRSSDDLVMNPKATKGLKRPCGVSCNRSGELVIVEREICKVSIYTSAEFKLVRNFGSCGSGLGQFVDPDGVTVDANDNILVVDSGNHRIQKFTKEGKFVTMVGIKGEGPLQFNHPTNIKVHPKSGHLYVCDQYNHRVQVMGEDFTFVGSFGKEGNNNGEFLYPTDLAFDNAGNVFVSDTGNNRIQIFDPDGNFLHIFMYEEGKDTIPSPSCLCISYDETLYVANSTNLLSVLSSSERLLVGTIGKGEGPLNMPHLSTVHGITVDRDGKIHATDSATGMVCSF